MTTITALPTPPSRSDPANFRARADAFLDALPDFGTEINTVAGEVNTNATTASTGASTATTKAAEAAASAAAAQAASNAVAWVSGTTYAEGIVVWSPTTHLSYRRKSAGAGTTDPSVDPGNWAALSAGIPTLSVVAGTSQSAITGMHYILSNAAATTVTLPATPTAGDLIVITIANGRSDNLIARNGKSIQGLAEDLTIDNTSASIWLRYANDTLMWRIL